MKTRFLTVFPLLSTTGLLLEDSRGRVVGRTRLDPLTQRTMFISKDRRSWDETKKCYSIQSHPPQADVDFVTDDGKKAFKTAEECLSYELMQRFGVGTLDEIANMMGCYTLPEIIIEDDTAPDAEQPIPDFKVAEESIIERIESETVKEEPLPEPKAPPAKPATKAMTAESIKLAIDKMLDLISRGGLQVKTLARRLDISEASVQRIVADREDLFIARDNGKIYIA